MAENRHATRTDQITAATEIVLIVRELRGPTLVRRAGGNLGSLKGTQLLGTYRVARLEFPPSS
jgi:hypothetical protein